MELRLKNLRENNGYTEKQIAEYLLCGEAEYVRYEEGKSAIPLEYLVKLADLYNVGVDCIIEHK